MAIAVDEEPVADLAGIEGLADLWERTRGDERISVAVLEGPVDTDHPAFQDARLTRLDGPWPGDDAGGSKLQQSVTGPARKRGFESRSELAIKLRRIFGRFQHEVSARRKNDC